MSYGVNFRTLNLRYAYQLAATISEIIRSDEYFSKYIWFWAIEADDYYSELINENIEKVSKPVKETLLHIFIRDIFHMVINHDLYWFDDDYYNWEFEEIEEYVCENIVNKLNYYGIKATGFPKTLNTIYKKFESDKIDEAEYLKAIREYVDKVSSQLDRIENQIVGEVFYLLFNDKIFVYEFNKRLTAPVMLLENTNIKDSTGNIKRCYLPDWLKKAIFYRDNGRCQKCGKDLSGIMQITEERGLHFDHVIPLDKGGTNDPTNFQLLCSECNLKKSGKDVKPTSTYQYYW